MVGQHHCGSLQRRADHVAHVDGLAIQRDATGLQPRHVEQIGDKPGETLGFFLDRARKFVAGGRIIEVRVLA